MKSVNVWLARKKGAGSLTADGVPRERSLIRPIKVRWFDRRSIRSALHKCESNSVENSEENQNRDDDDFRLD
jgi:hypothetical protein